MRYTGLELFMEKLKHMIYNNNNPIINNHPSILSRRPEFQLLYEELGSIIETLHSIDEHHELQQVTDLKKRFKDAAQEAHDIIDLFVYNINRGSQVSLDLEDVMRLIKSIKDEFLNMSHGNMKMDSFTGTECQQIGAIGVAGPSCSKNSLRKTKVLKDDVVGFDRPAALIRDKLVEDQKQLDVVSIVGMAGQGKTTLATKIFNDPFIMYHFHVRGWVTVSQKYQKRDLLVQILESIDIKLETEGDSYCQLREMLHKRLMGNRYLIVIDDIWSTEAWDDVKLFFPNNHTRSRILLTSRHKEVVLHANSLSFIHHLEFLTEYESWELLCKKVFPGGNDCPNSLVEPGMAIAKKCQGLPLAVVVIAGVLLNEAVNKESWEKISRNVSSYISDQTGYVETLTLSFDHLPSHLRDCYLYLGGFPEDYKFQVQSLIWLWEAEGFIPEDGDRSVEESAKDYLMELVDRNLLVVTTRKFNGDIKTFYVHDLLREICLEIATKESFFMKTQYSMHSVASCKQRRIFIEHNIRITNDQMIRTLLCVYPYTDTRNLICKWSHIWTLLMVLDIRNWELDYFPEEISQLVHLRYLAFFHNGYFPSAICNLWSLQTLVVRGGPGILKFLKLPNTISDLENLRHLQCDRVILFPMIQKPMNLQTISIVQLRYGADDFVNYFPFIKKIPCLVHPDMQYNFQSLTFLKKLKINGNRIYIDNTLLFQKIHIGFPVSLKTLTLKDSYLPWSDMSVIQSLPNLEVLRLLSNAFVGSQWDTGEQQFQRLRFLKLSSFEIRQWEASDINFPCLKQLVLEVSIYLSIPSKLGYIPTLELILIEKCSEYDGFFQIEHISMKGDHLSEFLRLESLLSIEEVHHDQGLFVSLLTIEEEQHDQGNFELKISFKEKFRDEAWRMLVEDKFGVVSFKF